MPLNLRINMENNTKHPINRIPKEPNQWTDLEGKMWGTLKLPSLELELENKAIDTKKKNRIPKSKPKWFNRSRVEMGGKVASPHLDAGTPASLATPNWRKGKTNGLGFSVCKRVYQKQNWIDMDSWDPQNSKYNSTKSDPTQRWERSDERTAANSSAGSP